MKIIHTADIHLGSRMDSRFSKEIANERKAELRNTFKRLVEYAKENDVSVIMLCGDVFDSDMPFKKDKDFFYSIVTANPEIDFLYLKGNHDINDSIPEVLPENLKLFSEQWTTYSYGDVVICGMELCPANRLSYYASLVLEKEKYNIVMLHGQISDSLSGGDVNLKKLKNKNIDYLALGHIHKPSQGQIDERGEYVYCGCLEGRGFDEPGEHGFVLLNTEKEKHTHIFIPFSQRKINEIDVDIAGCKSAYEAYTRVKNSAQLNKRDLYRINNYALLMQTAELLQEADKRLKDRYISPIKNNFISYAEMLETAIGEKVTMTPNFEIRYERNGIERSEKHLSSGQRSICAFCFRIALIDNMYTEEKPFLILDDPFVSLDQKHMDRVKEMLKKLSDKLQLVYFTCHASRAI